MRISKSLMTNRLFFITLILKFIDSLLEIIGGMTLLIVRPEFITKELRRLFRYELLRDPKDFLVNHLINLFSYLSINTRFFISLYLIVHGIVKLFLIFSLSKERLWAYAVSEIVFAIILSYEIYRLFFNQSIYLIVLIFLDLIFVYLMIKEHNRLIKKYISV